MVASWTFFTLQYPITVAVQNRDGYFGADEERSHFVYQARARGDEIEFLIANIQGDNIGWIPATDCIIKNVYLHRDLRQ